MSNYTTYKTMRWFGDNDSVHLADLRQTGCEGIVTALHHIPVGEVWPIAEIEERKQRIEKHGMQWMVVESLPVHEDIKKRTGDYVRYIDNYKESLKNLAACGIYTVTYNFMPVFDWLRTSVTQPLENGAKTLRFNYAHYKIFDLFILEREGSDVGLSQEQVSLWLSMYESMSQIEKESLKHAILLGLPGSTERFTIDQIKAALQTYDGITAADLQSHLVSFLEEITPVAEDHNVFLTIHPDDPPFSVFGLPRVVSTQSDLNYIFSKVDSVHNGLCFCTGSLGAGKDNDVLSIFENFRSKIHFLHLRNTERMPDGTFSESNHLEGDTNMHDVMKKIIEVMQTEKRRIPMRPDHGPQMLDDLTKSAYPGYSLIGRLKGLAELSGLEYALTQ